MADGDIKIKDLSEALQIDNNAEFVYTQDNGGTNTTFKATVNQIARKIAESVTYTNLETTSKTLVGAINELSHLGNPILLGTTAPTSSQGANGNIYVQYTEGTGGSPDTVDSIYAKIDGAWCEIETGGGGGSGGHTIVDNEGVSLEQRTNLQFNGAYSEDNSTDDTTEVNVVREMTKAEFDLLSADEKVGFINITDITGGNDDRFQPVIYSEDEREIGVWADGRPWYQKTLHIIPENPVPSKTDTSIPLTGLSADAEILGFISVFGGYNGPNSYVSGWRMFTFDRTSTDYSVTAIRGYSKSSIIVWPGNDFSDFTTVDNRFREFYITVQYTKTTDTAGSGQWTPQGVPAHHYSTDEQVIGTWIDGSTLYEKTVYIPSLPNNSFDEYNTGLSNITPISFDNTLIFQSGNTSKAPYINTNGTVAIAIQFNTNGKIFFGTNTDQSLTSAYVTLRYTKSSS